jgi:hypothetical protein
MVQVLYLLRANAQELYVNTEPASNMAAGSMGVRLNTKFYQMEYNQMYSYRIDPEIMLGLSKNVMIHLNAFASDMYQPNLKFEGGSAYAKWRFYSADDIHRHFRIAAFGKVALIDNPTTLSVNSTYYTSGPNGEQVPHVSSQTYSSDEIDLDGNNSGMQGGLVATQLLHKLALSSSTSLLKRWNNIDAAVQPGQSTIAFNYSISAGWLFLPFDYRNFRQTNINLYCELLGSSALDKNANYLDIAPAIQFIFNSISRLDLSYRIQIAGNMDRLADNSFLVRFEYNFLNLFKPFK